MKAILKRFKNPYFVVGLAGLFLATTGIKPEELTSWAILGERLTAVANNPYVLIGALLALMGQVIDPTTPGLKDVGNKSK